MKLQEIVSNRCGKEISQCTNEELYYALLEMTKGMAEEKVSNQGKRKLYYISAEFLIGKLLSNNLINLGIYDDVAKFLKENGKEILKPYFHEISWQEYKDKLEIQDAEPLIAYILSCHGNQNQYILSRYQEFRDYVIQKAGKGYVVTKEAGIFVCR